MADTLLASFILAACGLAAIIGLIGWAIETNAAQARQAIRCALGGHPHRSHNLDAATITCTDCGRRLL